MGFIQSHNSQGFIQSLWNKILKLEYFLKQGYNGNLFDLVSINEHWVEAGESDYYNMAGCQLAIVVYRDKSTPLLNACSTKSPLINAWQHEK